MLTGPHGAQCRAPGGLSPGQSGGAQSSHGVWPRAVPNAISSAVHEFDLGGSSLLCVQGVMEAGKAAPRWDVPPQPVFRTARPQLAGSCAPPRTGGVRLWGEWPSDPGGSLPLSPGDGGVGEAQLPFAECHPPVIDADGAVAEPGHNEGAMGVAGEARHAAVGARGDVLGPTQTRQAPWGQGPTLASCPRSWAQRQAGSICPSYSPGPRPAAQRTQPQTPP